MSLLIPAAKMNGLGNEILIADMREQKAELRPDFIRALAANPQTAFDQLMAIYDKPDNAAASAYILQIRNADGTEAKACGNGTRCAAEWLHSYGRQNERGETQFRFLTKGGQITAERLVNGQVTVNMGRPHFNPAAIPMNFTPENMNAVPLAKLLPDAQEARRSAAPTGSENNAAGRSAAPAANKKDGFGSFPQTCAILSIGNPHAVFFIRDRTKALNDYPLDKFGPALERSPAFPQGVNVSLAQVESPADIALRVWERGAGLTRACGTAACATAFAAHRLGLTGAEVNIRLPGGALHIALRDNSCFMTGDAEYEYGGMLNLESGEFIRGGVKSDMTAAGERSLPAEQARQDRAEK